MERGEHTRVTPAERQLEARMAGAAGDRAPRGQPIMPATWAQADGASRLARAGYHGLILLALVLPFEFTQRPLLSTSFLTITNVKVVLYAVAALAAVSLAQYGKAAARDADLRRAWRPLRIPLALFAGLLLCFLLSSAMARERADGLKWTSDLLVGGLLWAVTPLWLAQERERKIRAIARAIVVGAVIAATAGILEYILGAGFAADLSWFKPKPTLAGAFLRLSGTFQYANIAAMYMEMALPFAVAGLIEALARPHRRWVPVLAWILAVEVLLEALLLTFSRGALLGLAVAAGVTLLIVRRLRPRRSLAPRQRLALGATAGLAVLLAAITIASTPLALLRFTSQSDQEWYRADYVSRVPATMLACQQLTVPVTVENHSPFLWQSQGPDLYNLGYHWLYASGKVAIFENPRSRLQGTVPPGAAQTVPAHIQAPPRAGRYLLVWDMVQENVTWFSLKRAAYVGLPVLVRQGPSPRGAVCAGHARRAVAHGDGPAELPRSFSQPGRTQLWAAALRMLATHPLLGVGPDGYRFRYGAYMRPPLATWDTRILANQLFLELFADLGLLGGGLFLAFLCAVWWPLVVALWTRRRSTVILWQIILLAALAAFLGHGLVDYLLESHAIFLLLWLICGLASATYLRPTLPGPRRTGLDPSSQVAGPAPRENTTGRGSTQPARTEGAQCL